MKGFTRCIIVVVNVIWMDNGIFSCYPLRSSFRLWDCAGRWFVFDDSISSEWNESSRGAVLVGIDAIGTGN